MFCIRYLLKLLLVFILASCATVDRQTHSQLSQLQYNAGLAAMQQNRNDEAVELFLSMTRDFPKLAGPYANLGLLYQRQGLVKDATVAFDQAISLRPNSAKIYNSAAVFYRSQGRFKDAELAYLGAIDKADDYADPVLNLAILYDLYLRQPVNAIKYYKQYLALDGDNNQQQVMLWLADLEQRQP